MPNTTRMKWPFPNRNQEPHYDALVSLFSQQDASGYAAREDRHIIFQGGGPISFDATSGVLSWDSPIEILAPITGFNWVLQTGQVTVDDSELVYVDLVRAPTLNRTVTPNVASQVPSTDIALLIGIRRGNQFYFRSGALIGDGETLTDIAPGSGGSSTGVDYKESVRVATDVALPAYGRVNNVITANVAALPTIDGVALNVGDRLLLKDGASNVDNGIYDVTDVGAPFVLTRSSDFNTDAEVTAGAQIPVEEGTLYADKLFTLTTNDPIIVNTTGLAFAVTGGGGGGGYTQTFVDGDLTAGVITIVHNLGSTITAVTVRSNLNQMVMPDDVTMDPGGLQLDLDLSSYGPLPGTWEVLVSA